MTTEFYCGATPIRCEIVPQAYARDCFFRFLDSLRSLRRDLICTGRSAWFRGHENSNYTLSPSLFRKIGSDRIDYLKRINESDRNLRISDEKTKRIDQELGRLKSLDANPRILADIKGKIEARTAELKRRAAYEKRKNLWIELGHGDPDIHADILKVDEEIEKSESTLERNDLLRLRKNLLALGNGERDAYTSWSCRSGRNYSSSWEALSEMQHYNIGTRLLDWSEDLSVALYFSLTKIRHAIFEIEQDLKNTEIWTLYESGHLIAPMEIRVLGGVENVPTPEIWVLNPYKLAKCEKNWRKLALIDPLHDPNLDYYRSFLLNHDWPFEFPMPFAPKWTDARLSAQMGLFTVFGNDRRSFEEQLGGETNREIQKDYKIYGTRRANFLGRLTISSSAAVYALQHIREFTGQSDHAIFRDHDSLGKYIQSRFIQPIRRGR